MIEVAELLLDDEPANTFYTAIEGLTLRYNAAASHRPQDALVFKGRCDSGTRFARFQVIGASNDGIRFEKGGINVHCYDFRMDGVEGAAIRWMLGSIDNLSLKRFTTDNKRDDLEVSGNGLAVEGNPQPGPDSHLYLAVQNAKVEQNTPVDEETGGAFVFNLDSAATPRQQIMASFDNTFVESIIGDDVGLRVNPANDNVNFTLTQSKMKIVGIPSYRDSFNDEDGAVLLACLCMSAPEVAPTPGRR
jgi:hypothetical protein